MTHTPGKSVLNGLRASASSVVGGFGSMFRGVGFWTAILLPVLYIPLMVIGHPWLVDVANLMKVFALHAASLLVGKGHAGGVDHE